MALEILVTTDRYRNDPMSRDLIEFLRTNQRRLKLDLAVLYYDFPAYVDYETETTRPDILLFSASHGFIAIRFIDNTVFQRSSASSDIIDSGLNDFCSNLYARLLRSRDLRKSRTLGVLDVHPIIIDMEAKITNPESLESKLCRNYDQFEVLLDEFLSDAVSDQIVAEARSVVEGAKALSRPQKRVIASPQNQPLAVAMSKLEAEIANFDQKQRHIALVDVGGPARIRGLAGSGKTVILAMKAAHLHLNNPKAKILITFLTKSLRATIKNLITRFYRHYSETDPDWKFVHIRHGWGGTIPGVYSEAARRAERPPLTFSEAQKLSRTDSPFSVACETLLSEAKVVPYYDHILIDEGQDFPASFYRMCFDLAKGERDRKSIVWAYDELQDIMNVKIRQPDELFGRDLDGEDRVSLDRSSRHVPPGATNDAILEKCYRNQRDVLVCAHALGFGVYGGIVQLLESADHWRDVGYEVLTGDLVVGQKVQVKRPDRNSPIQINDIPNFPLVETYKAGTFDEEISWVDGQVKNFIKNGLEPEEIVVISMDDRNAKSYLSGIAEKLAYSDISSNNVIADPYNEPPFSIPGRVTLSTVYRAKGNEAAAVIAVGVDAVATRSRGGRNRMFTAFTRSKAWLRISGIGEPAAKIFQEVDSAIALAPEIHFEMPDLKEIDTIQRGLSRKQAKAKAAREEYFRKLRAAGYSEEEIEEELSAGPKSE